MLNITCMTTVRTYVYAIFRRKTVKYMLTLDKTATKIQKKNDILLIINPFKMYKIRNWKTKKCKYMKPFVKEGLQKQHI